LSARHYAGPRHGAAIQPDSIVPSPAQFLPAILATVAVVLGLFTAAWLFAPDGTPQLESGTLLQQPRALPAFQFQSSDGQPFTPERLQQRWTLIFPGFTYCPDICPTTLTQLKQLHALTGRRAQIVLLSVDPARDTPQRLAEYLAFFDPDFIGVTAPEPELGRLTQALGIAYIQVPGAGGQDYSLDHSAALVLINPQGRIAGYFMPPFRLDQLAADLNHLFGSRS
jgi:protein SCO1